MTKTKAFTLAEVLITLAEQAQPVLNYCTVSSTERDCSLLMLRIRAKSAAPVTLCSTQFAFTLAEVLITLAVIGVVAAMTMPTLIAKHQETVTITKLKKFYSVMSQAYQMAEHEYGDPSNWYMVPEATAAENIMYVFLPYLKTLKICGGSGTGCWYNAVGLTVDGRPGTNNGNADTISNYARWVLADGSSVRVSSRSTTTTCSGIVAGDGDLSHVCAYLEVDINGTKRPNQFGVDHFYFYITKTRIVPFGISSETTNYPFPASCDINNKSINNNGYGCTAWVIYNENMDYLHCNDLSWGGKTKCN